VGELFLVAEDDAMNRRVLLNQLAVLGHAAEFAADGEEALRLWRNGRYAALLTDLHMPVMDGFSLALAIRAEQGPQDHRPIIALSADVLPSTERRTSEAGIDLFLSKPVSLDRLREVLRECLKPAADQASPATAAPRRVRDAARLDPSVLASVVGTDERVVAEFLDAFGASLAQSRIEFVDAWQARDRRRIASLAHRLKSASRAMGAMALGDSCADLENAAHAAGENDIGERVQTLCSEMHEVGQAVVERRIRCAGSADKSGSTARTA
jgi:CheY-like chemotaxis protein